MNSILSMILDKISPKNKSLYKWWIISGIISSIIFFILAFFIFRFNSILKSYLYVYPAIIISFLSAVIAEYISKSKKVSYIIIGGFISGAILSILYYFLIFICIVMILSVDWSAPLAKHNLSFGFLIGLIYTVFYMIVIFIPISIIGGLITYISRKLIYK